MGKLGLGWQGKAGALLCAVALLALSGAARAETIEDALVAAYTTNPDLQAARAKLRATDEEVPTARAGWLPTITVTASYGYQSARQSSPFNILGVPVQSPN